MLLDLKSVYGEKSVLSSKAEIEEIMKKLLPNLNLDWGEMG